MIMLMNEKHEREGNYRENCKKKKKEEEEESEHEYEDEEVL